MVTSVDCSGCREKVLLDVPAGTVIVRVAPNGLRGSKHRPAHEVTSDLGRDEDGLLVWDCPACGHADSFDPDA